MGEIQRTASERIGKKTDDWRRGEKNTAAIGFPFIMEFGLAAIADSQTQPGGGSTRLGMS